MSIEHLTGKWNWKPENRAEKSRQKIADVVDGARKKAAKFKASKQKSAKSPCMARNKSGTLLFLHEAGIGYCFKGEKDGAIFLPDGYRVKMAKNGMPYIAKQEACQV